MKESEIRSKDIHQGIIELSKEDVESLILSHKDELIDVDCPGCGKNNSVFQFNKFGMGYRLCQDCNTLFLSPRPSEIFLEKIYPKMKSVKYWESEFYRQTAEPRREKIYRPRAKKVIDICRRFDIAEGKIILDVGCGYGIFLDELRKFNFFSDYLGLEPASELASISRERGIDVIDEPVQRVKMKDFFKPPSVITCFEVLEHAPDTAIFLNSMANLLPRGGLLILTAPTVSGLDIQLLWENSKTIYPPHHINLLSVEGLEALIKRTNSYEILEVFTPGKLDVDILRNELMDGKVKTMGRFFDYVFWRNNEELFSQLQDFCSSNNLSSHLMAILKKK